MNGVVPAPSPPARTVPWISRSTRATTVLVVLGMGALSGCGVTSSAGSGPSGGGEDGVTAAVEPEPGTYRVQSVTDGDTIRLTNGDAVRLVGMDAPEPGRCGSERATQMLADLVLGRRVSLPAPGDDRDLYGRLLRYVDVGRVDAGLRLIRSGLAVARYDSRDGYDRHPRQARYVRADRASPNVTC